MAQPDKDEISETDRLLGRAAAGEAAAVDELLGRDRERLRRMIDARLDRRLRGRVDVSDVLQDVALEATRRLPDYLAERTMPFFVWLRFLAAQHLAGLWRHHLGARRRDARREVQDPWAHARSSIDGLVTEFAAKDPSPTKIVRDEERRRAVERALSTLDDEDREVLCLRHYEQLSNVEVARELGIETSAASKRYLRALKRLKDELERRGDVTGAGP